MFIKSMRHLLMDQAGEEGDATGGGADPQAASTEPATVLQAATEQPKGIPEKFQVKNEDGSLNLEASSDKMAEAYSQIEKRVGSGDLPPKTAGEYTVTVPEHLTNVWKPEGDAMLDAFKEKALAAGYTQAQFDLAIATYGDIAPGLVAGSTALSAEECTAELKQTWKTDAEMTAGTESAARALNAYGGDDAKALVTKYGNDPALIRFLSRIGKEVAEDKSLDPGQALGSDTIEALEASNAYKDPRDPQHAAVSAKVRDYYEKKAAQDAKAGNALLM